MSPVGRLPGQVSVGERTGKSVHQVPPITFLSDKAETNALFVKVIAVEHLTSANSRVLDVDDIWCPEVYVTVVGVT